MGGNGHAAAVLTVGRLTQIEEMSKRDVICVDRILHSHAK